MAHRAAYREAHPKAAQITHWINLISIFVLILTGFYIHYPAFGGAMGVARGLHIFFGFVLLINLVVRVIFAFTLKSAPVEGTREVVSDWRSWMPQKANRHQLWPTIKYYLFIKRTHPRVAKYNPLQKIAYLLVPILIIIMGFSGLALWAPTQDWPIFVWACGLVGGLPGMRVVHYVMMFVIILFVIVHVYLAADESSLMALMLFDKEHEGYKTDAKTGGIIGYDDLVDDSKDWLGHSE